jgi:hypothetical protein
MEPWARTVRVIEMPTTPIATRFASTRFEPSPSLLPFKQHPKKSSPGQAIFALRLVRRMERTIVMRTMSVASGGRGTRLRYSFTQNGVDSGGQQDGCLSSWLVLLRSPAPSMTRTVPDVTLLNDVPAGQLALTEIEPAFEPSILSKKCGCFLHATFGGLSTQTGVVITVQQ